MLFITVVTRWGASFGVLVNYLVPAVALAYGAAFLDESITASRVAGLLLVLLGVGLGSGVIRRRRAPVATGAGDLG
jgi:drug/metabolite transporter (DMT)-like permease